MASIVDSLNEAFLDSFAPVKLIGFAIPVYFAISSFMAGNLPMLYIWGSVIAVLFLALLTQGIYNVRRSKREILSLNPFMLVKDLAMALVAIVPNAIVWIGAGFLIVKNITIPIEVSWAQITFECIVYIIVSSIVMTSYLSFAKTMKVPQAYNYKVIFDSCVDVLIAMLFFLFQLVLVLIILFGPVVYLYSFFKVPKTHWTFLFYASVVAVVSLSVSANYLAQIAYECIPGNNEEYDNNYDAPIDLIDEAAERMNGK